MRLVAASRNGEPQEPYLRTLEGEIMPAFKAMLPKLYLPESYQSRTATRLTIDRAVAAYFSLELDCRDRMVVPQPREPSPRAKLLCTLNPETFKGQDHEGTLSKIVRYEYEHALKTFVT